MSTLYDNTPIFGELAPIYFSMGLPVIPLQPFNNQSVKSPGKQPIPYGWQIFATEPVPEHTQQNWIASYPNANIGLVTGPQSGIVFIDVDSVNPKVQGAIMKALGVESPWIRIGQKGYIAAYRYTPYIKNFKIRDTDGNTLVECLAFRNQAVIPPSIHPKTLKPYSANCELLSVFRNLPILPEGLEKILREEIQLAGIELHHTGMSNLSDFVARGARDNQMTYVAGLFAHYVTKGERSLEEAFGQMEKWYETSVQRVAGDDIDLSKGYQKIVEFLQRDVVLRKKPLPLGWDRDIKEETRTQLQSIFTEEHKEWTAEELKAYTYREFLAHADPEDPERMKAVQYIIERISRSPSLNNLERESVIAYISQTARIPGLSIPNIRKRIRELQQGDMSGSSHTEIAQAVIDKMREFGEMRQMNGMFYQWKGAQWDPLDDTDIMLTITQHFDGFELTKRHNDLVGILKTMRVLVTEKLKQMDFKGVNFANGFLGEDMKLYQHLPDYGAIYTLPYRYMPDLPEPTKFLRLLEDSWGNDDDFMDKVQALREMIGATLFQYCTNLQRCTLLYGAANSGKSTILKVVAGLFPEDVISVCPPDSWNDKFAPTTMAGRLLNIAGELPAKKMIDGKSFKEIIDGNELNGQMKGGQLFKFAPVASHWFASNHLPHTDDTSEGFNRRWLMLEFRKPIEQEAKVIGLHNIIITEEREAIAAWAIKSFPALMQRTDPILPISHERLINDMANDNNSVRFFLNESRRILTKVRLEKRLVAQTLQTVESQPEILENKVVEINAGAQAAHATKVTGRQIHASSFTSVEQFNGYAIANPMSEDAVYSEYAMFCGQQAGVRAVGLRHFRVRMRELEFLHKYKVNVIETKDGYEKCEYPGIVLLAMPKSS
jgi:energy-coupling factor transporter ATP-binding protein EcfA2